MTVHPVDRAARLLFRYGPDSLKVFQDGWGDEDQLDLLDVERGLRTSEPIDLRLDRIDTGGVSNTDWSFESPAGHLPEAMRRARVRVVAPALPSDRLVVLMAAWNDHDYTTRTGLATRLIERGVSCAMLENPYYGSRRLHTGAAIRTVGEFAAMGRAAVEEGLALLDRFSRDYKVGIAGFSMGGNIAAMIGALTSEPVAIAALAASHSPGPVWADGLISHTVDWQALGEQRERLREVLGRASVLGIEAVPHTSAAVIVGGRRDGYIPAHAVEALHDHWPGSELRWLRAGHASMIWRHKDDLVDAIVASFARLENGFR